MDGPLVDVVDIRSQVESMVILILSHHVFEMPPMGELGLHTA